MKIGCFWFILCICKSKSYVILPFRNPLSKRSYPVIRHRLMYFSPPTECIEDVEKSDGDIDKYYEGKQGI